MMSLKEKFTSLKGMVGNKPVFSRERVAEMERPVRCIIPPRVSPSQRWLVIQHKNFLKGFPRLRRGGCIGKEQQIKGNSLMYLIKHSWKRPWN